MKKLLKSVDDYIASAPKEAQPKLRELRSLIRMVAPDAKERTDYFEMPGYSYDGYDYDGMFAWFSFEWPYVRLHVRPPVLQSHAKELSRYRTTKAILNLPIEARIPMTLVKKLVKESIKVMKAKR